MNDGTLIKTGSGNYYQYHSAGDFILVVEDSDYGEDSYKFQGPHFVYLGNDYHRSTAGDIRGVEVLEDEYEVINELPPLAERKPNAGPFVIPECTVGNYALRDFFERNTVDLTKMPPRDWHVTQKELPKFIEPIKLFSGSSASSMVTVIYDVPIYAAEAEVMGVNCFVYALQFDSNWILFWDQEFMIEWMVLHGANTKEANFLRAVRM